MDANQRKRLKWILLYQRHRNAGKVCLKCGISRPTLRKWLRLFEQQGIEGLKDKSRRPLNSPSKKITPKIKELILDLRKNRRLGVKRIRSELYRLHDISLSLAAIHKVLQRNHVKPLPKYRRKRRKTKRYNCSIPGERVQIDVCKIAPSLYQFTAIDDCTRWKILGLYPRPTASNSLKFLEKVIEEMPFPIQIIQTDRGREFFAYSYQEVLMKWGIKFRPVRPRSPHLNGKVERSQRTDLEEFYAIEDINTSNLSERLQEWQHYWNWERPHSSIGGKSPIYKWSECIEIIPSTEKICNEYNPKEERFRLPRYREDLMIGNLK
jgi:transposase InsO family protein